MFAVVSNNWGTDGLFKQHARAEQLATEVKQCLTSNSLVNVVTISSDPEIAYAEMIRLFGEGPAANRVHSMLRHGRTGICK